ncbi:ParB/RepB/Spo0J family partition protein [Mesorhizobium sp. M2A.F.Ca.ET.043.02.1.1]|uniref:ParB/RepB/Spo0J family partition protein n=1 Tax=Mesorhizobium sp. M2A.F.Ca.ET.043.02.1.1 TaxID=2493670 RepID=UPI000F750FD5|nr:ParB/RepB/Spo0J family partition protein [Mesorhizobium sp. M2A.F.Ca.ET.043.02.1.1]AZO04333.1 hypothetical protein EJ068_15600 [Mesorhizobium sp. M2A.F.Ca.ET.043.02.1.1]
MTDYTPDMHITEALPLLREELKLRTEDHPGNIQELHPADIRRKVAVFQPRTLEGRLIEDESHVQTLVEAIGNPQNARFLDPLLVWWSGAHWYVIDGFHRLLAYRKAGVKMPVPVEVFSGTLEEAVEASAASNSKDKLPMTKRDKTNMAWRLTLFFEGRSKRQVAEACAVSERTVATMRRARKELISRGGTLEEIPEDWEEARRDWQRLEPARSVDFDVARRAKIERWAKSLSKTFGRTIYDDPDAFAGALKFLEARFARWLIESPVWATDLAEYLEVRHFADELSDY